MTIINNDPNQVVHTQPLERSNENDHVSSDAPGNSKTKEVKIFSEMVALPDIANANISSSAPPVVRPFFH